MNTKLEKLKSFYFNKYMKALTWRKLTSNNLKKLMLNVLIQNKRDTERPFSKAFGSSCENLFFLNFCKKKNFQIKPKLKQKIL